MKQTLAGMFILLAAGGFQHPFVPNTSSQGRLSLYPHVHIFCSSNSNALASGRTQVCDNARPGLLHSPTCRRTL